MQVGPAAPRPLCLAVVANQATTSQTGQFDPVDETSTCALHLSTTKTDGGMVGEGGEAVNGA